MALVTFRSRAAGEFIMLAENARHIFEILGRPPAERGVITAEQIPDALARLTAAVNKERAQSRDRQHDEDLRDESVTAPQVTLTQRTMPLIDMLRAAQKRDVDVTWGV